MSVYLVSFLQACLIMIRPFKKCLTVIGPKHSISATTEGNAIENIHVGELEIISFNIFKEGHPSSMKLTFKGPST